MFDPEVTLYAHFKEVDKPYYRPLSFALDRIKSGKVKDRVDTIRSLNNKEERDAIKRNLPAVVFSGKCGERKDSNMIEYSGLIILDLIMLNCLSVTR